MSEKTQEDIKEDWSGKGGFAVGDLRYCNEHNEMKKLEIASFEKVVRQCTEALNQCVNEKQKMKTPEDIAKNLFYDSTSGNVHFAPEYPNEIDLDFPSEKLSSILKIVKDALPKNTAALYYATNFKEPRLGTMRNIAGYTSYIHERFVFIQITMKSKAGTRYYDLMLFRCANTENGVCCDLGVVQMLRSNRRNIRSIDFYSDHLENDTNIPLVCGHFRPTYYNPPLTINNSAEEIANAFANFITESEKQWSALCDK